MSSAGKLLSAGEAGRPGPHNRNALAGTAWCDARSNPPFTKAAVDNLTLDCLDGHRRIVEIERAGGFARRGANAAGEFRKVVGCVQAIERPLPLAACGELIPVRYQVVDRASRMAERNFAIHAALCLLVGFPSI